MNFEENMNTEANADLAATKIVVVGQGYVGLPLAVRAVEVGYTVVGYDIDKNRIGRLVNGDSFVEDVPSDQLAAAFDTGRFAVSDELSSVAGFDIAVITVPTPPRRRARPELHRGIRCRPRSLSQSRRNCRAGIDDLPRNH